PGAFTGLVHRRSGQHRFEARSRSPGALRLGARERLCSPALQGRDRNAQLLSDRLNRCAFRRQQPRYSAIFKCLPISGHVPLPYRPQRLESIKATTILTQGAPAEAYVLATRTEQEVLAHYNACLTAAGSPNQSMLIGRAL